MRITAHKQVLQLLYQRMPLSPVVTGCTVAWCCLAEGYYLVAWIASCAAARIKLVPVVNAELLTRLDVSYGTRLQTTSAQRRVGWQL